jgi:hypothetical protein
MNLLEAQRRSVPVANPNHALGAIPELVKRSLRHGGLLAWPQGLPPPVDRHVEASLEHLVVLDLLGVDMRWRRQASGREDELHLDGLAPGLGRRTPDDVRTAVGHVEPSPGVTIWRDPTSLDRLSRTPVGGERYRLRAGAIEMCVASRAGRSATPASRPGSSSPANARQPDASQRAGSRTLRCAAVEAANQVWRPSNLFHNHYRRLAATHGTNPAKVAVARKLLICAWHMLSRDRPSTHPGSTNAAGIAPSVFRPPDGPHGIERPRQLPGRVMSPA